MPRPILDLTESKTESQLRGRPRRPQPFLFALQSFIGGDEEKFKEL